MELKFTFQDPISPIMYGISALHDHILFFLALILFTVVFIFITTVKEFVYVNQNNTFLVHDEFDDLYYFPRAWFIEARVFAGRDAEAYKNRKFYWQWAKLNSGTLIEIVWTIIPSVILLLIAIPSFALLFAIDEITVSKVIVKVIGHQWYWSYEVTGMINNASFTTAAFDSYMLADSDLVKGDLRLLKTDNALILPKNMPILVLITSDDVLHSWAVPSFGVKVDAIPGRLSQISLLLKNSGIFNGQCSELCGVNHGFMPIEVWVVDIYTYTRLEMFLSKVITY